MGGEGRRTTLAEAADLLTGFPFKSADFTDELSDIRLVRGDNVIQGTLRWEGVKRWPGSKLDVHRDYLLRPGDVVLAMDRPWIEAGLKHATLTEADCPSLLVQRVARLRARAGVNQRFLGYLIRSADFTNYILGVQTGTAVPHISGNQIKAYEFSLPPLKHQESAVELLGALDDKIELNRRMAETLEAMARALFQSWFVNFDPVRAKAHGRSSGLPANLTALFPDSFGEDGLPESWRTAALGDLVFMDRATKDPMLLGNAHVDHFSLPAFDAGQRPIREQASGIKSLKLIIKPPLVLFSKLNPETPRVWPVLARTGSTMLASTEFLALRPRPAQASLSFVASLLASNAFRDKAAGMVTGTSKSHQRVQPAALLQLMWIAPTAPVLAAFDEVAAPLLRRADNARQETDSLASLRDTLLPKLISGELRSADAEERIAAA